MSPSSVLPGLFNANPIAVFLCFYLLRVTSAELVASSQRLVQIGQTFHASCQFERRDVDRFLYWTLHYYHEGHKHQEFKANFGGIDLTTCSAISFDASNVALAPKAGLQGLHGQITCDLEGGPMGLLINKVRPEYNGLRFSCNSGRNASARSNEVSLIVGKPKLVTLEMEESGGKNHTAGVGTALRATCRVDKSLNPKFLYWATGDIDDGKNKSTLGGMIVEFCFRYKVRGRFHRRVDFNCLKPPAASKTLTVSSTLTVQSLPVGTTVFCHASINSGGDASSIIESDRLAISGSGRFTKLSISAKNSSVSINGQFKAKCRFLSSEYHYDIIMWQGVSKFGKRARIFYNKEQKESTLVIRPIYATDNQSQIFCSIVGQPATQSERIIIKVLQKVPTSLVIVRNESTIEPVPINGTFRAVCSFRNTDAQIVHWVVTVDHLIVGRVLIGQDACRTDPMITNTVTAGRVQISCDLSARTTTFSVRPVKVDDAGTEIYCAADDQYALINRSDSLSIMTQASANMGVIVKTRPTYREATLAASCPFGNGTETVFLVQPAGEDSNGNGEVATGNRTFILLNRNCSVIDYALYLPRRFFVDCKPDNESVILIIDPVYGNSSDDFQVTCAWYASFPSLNASSKPERKMLGLKRQVFQLVYPVSKPSLNYSGNMIKLNDTDTSVWSIPATTDQVMEFLCSAGISQSTSFNLSLYIQTDQGYSFRLPDGTKEPKGTTQMVNIRRKFRMKNSYVGVFCVAENTVSRWESDFARILLDNRSVFMSLEGNQRPNGSFFKHRMTATLELCYTLCELHSSCQGVSYHHKLCSLSSRGFPDSGISPVGSRFHHRLLLGDILQRNNFKPDVYKKHENHTLPFRGGLGRRTGLSVGECQKWCSKILPCRSILIGRVNNVCQLSSLMSAEKEGTTSRNGYKWDVYTKDHTPGTFIGIRGVFPDVDSRPVVRFSPPGAGNYESQLTQCADFCRSRSDCVSFLSTAKENWNSMDCFLYGVNVPDIRLVERVESRFESRFYARVRSLNSELLPVNRHTRPQLA